MIYIISLIMLMVCLISGGILVAMGPNVRSIVEKDFATKSFENAKLMSLQYADIASRANTLIPEKANPSAEDIANAKKAVPDLGWLYDKNNSTVTNQSATIRIYLGPGGAEMIEANVTQRQEKPDNL